MRNDLVELARELLEGLVGGAATPTQGRLDLLEHLDALGDLRTGSIRHPL